MGRRRELPVPPICPTCGEIPTYSKFPYCSCLCGNFYFEESTGTIRPVDYQKRNKRSRNFGWFSGKHGVKDYKEYERLMGWEDPGESDEQ